MSAPPDLFSLGLGLQYAMIAVPSAVLGSSVMIGIMASLPPMGFPVSMSRA